MKISRQTNVIVKMFFNLVFSMAAVIWKKDKTWWKYLPLAGILALDIFTLLFISLRKRQFENIFLQYTYNPSDMLFMITFFLELAMILSFYVFLGAWQLMIPNLFFFFGCYLYIYQNRKSQKVKIKNNIRMKFEYGVLTQDIDNSPLFKGAFVKITKKVGDKYVVKDHENNEYELEKEMIGEISKVDLN